MHQGCRQGWDGTVFRTLSPDMDNTSVGRMLLFYIEVPTARVYLCGYFLCRCKWNTHIYVTQERNDIYASRKDKSAGGKRLLLALATILSLIKIFDLPYGGSITLASMLPIVIIAYRRGLKWGLGAAGVYSVLQMLTGMQTVSAFFMPGDSQEVWWRALLIVFLDYIVAFTVIGFAAIFRKKALPPRHCAWGLYSGCRSVFLRILFPAPSFSDLMRSGSFQNSEILGRAFWTYSGATLALIYSVIYNAHLHDSRNYYYSLPGIHRGKDTDCQQGNRSL